MNQRTSRQDIVLPLQIKNFDDKIFTINSLLAVTTVRLAAQDRAAYSSLLDYVFSDTRVHYLATRSHFDSPFNNAAIIENILVNSILIIRKTDPSYLIASSTPHSLEAWVFAKCFEYLNLPIYMLDTSPIAYRAWISCGLDAHEIVLRQEGSAKSDLTQKSLKLIMDQREAKPGAKDKDGFHISRIYMNAVAGAKSNSWWSWKREMCRLFFGKIRSLPLRLLSAYLKWCLHNSYCDLATTELPEGPFVIFFMHYQPERTSLPEALVFVQQWIAIRMLSWELPAGWTLLVREHPAMWLKPLDITVRSINLFKYIASLERTEICSMDIDTFELIDKCQAVATLTGSVGFQSLLRSKPVIAFGVSSYKDHPACFSVKTHRDLVDAFSAIQNESISQHFTDDAIRDYVLWIEQNSYSADPEETDWMKARLKSFTEIYRQVLCGSLKLQ